MVRFFLSLLLTVVVIVVATDTSISTYQQYQHQEQQQQHQKQRSLGIYALYNLPPFAVEFTTLDTADILSSSIVVDVVDTTTTTDDDDDEEEKDEEISETGEYDSSISYPIRSLTEEFLLERFRLKIQQQQQQQEQDQEEEESYFTFYQHFESIDLQVRMYHQHNNKNKEEEEVREGHVHLIAEMFGTVAFLEPSQSEIGNSSSSSSSSSNKPSNDVVKELFGSWLEEIFGQDRDLYLRKLVQSEQELLREIVALDIITNYDVNNNNNNKIGRSSNNNGDGWFSKTIITFVVIIVGMVGIGWLCLFLVRRYQYKNNKSLHQHYGDDDDNNDDDDDYLEDRERTTAMDAVRHGGSSSSGGGEDSTTTSGRNYSIPSNPFGYIYSAFHQYQINASTNNNIEDGQSSSFGGGGPYPRSSFMSPPPRSSLVELQAGNIAVSSEQRAAAAMDDIDLTSPIPGQSGNNIPTPSSSSSSSYGYYYPFSNIWRNVSNMWDSNRQHHNDGLVWQGWKGSLPYGDEYDGNHGDDDDDMMRNNRRAMDQWMEFTPEDREEDYDFAFKDFPRKDGTPCLIYTDDPMNSSDHHHGQDIFSIGTIDIPTPTTAATNIVSSPLRENNGLGGDEILSDEAFRNLLGQASSFEDEYSVVSDGSSPEFKQRLSSLFSQKYRQYEKRAIVEKHQQKRKKEREMERRERQRDMHRELEALEASMPALVSDKWKSKHHVSPKPAASPKPYSQSPGGGSALLQNRRSPRRHHTPQKSWEFGLATYSSKSSPKRAGAHSPKPPTGKTNKSFGVMSLDGDPSGKLIRPRSIPGGGSSSTSSSSRSHLIPPSDLFVDTRYGTDPSSSSAFDDTTLDKLGVPGIASNNKKPSPNSVLDDIHTGHSTTMMMPPRGGGGGGASTITPTKKNSHRRRNSNTLNDYKRTSHHQQQEVIMETISNNNNNNNKVMDTITSQSPRRGPVRRGISPARRGLSPAPSRGRRTARGISPAGGGGGVPRRSSSNSSRHSRTGSKDDVFIHGVAALL